MNRNTVLEAARSWLGRKEADGSFKVIIDTYNSIVPLPCGYRMTYYDPWCAAFVSAVAQKVGATNIIYPECSCDRMIQLYQQHGRWMENDAYTPQPGDVIFYDWQDSGSGDNVGSSDHVGLVYSVVGTSMTIIEGNCSDSVCFTTRTVNQRYIRGYGLPDYENSVVTVPSTPAITVPQTNMAVGSKVKVTGSSWYTGALIPQWVKDDTWIILCINGDRVVLDKNVSGTRSIMSPINIKDIVLADSSTTTNVINTTPTVSVITSSNMTEKEMWDYLMSVYNNKYGVAGIMGNLYAESGLISTNLENQYESKLGYNDTTYTQSVDNGTYTNFVNDSAGYGLAQWTYWSLKKGLYNYAKSNKKSIGDARMQLEFLVSEFASLPAIVSAIKNATNIRTPSDIILTQYERPANQSEAVKVARANFGQNYLNKYGNSTTVTPSSNETNITPSTSKEYSVGDVVNFTGSKHYISSYLDIGFSCKPGKATITIINKKGKHPYHLIRTAAGGSTVYGWVDSGTFN